MFDPSRHVPPWEGYRSLPTAACGEPVLAARRPIPVQVWVIDATGKDRCIHAQATAWTTRAVRVTYTDDRGRIGMIWVWASAVARDAPSPRYRSRR